MTSWAVATLDLRLGTGAADEVDRRLDTLMSGSVCTPAHTPHRLCPAPPRSHTPLGDPQPLAVLTGLGAPRDGPSGDFLPGKLGGGVNKASRWLPAGCPRAWERASPGAMEEGRAAPSAEHLLPPSPDAPSDTSRHAQLHLGRGTGPTGGPEAGLPAHHGLSLSGLPSCRGRDPCPI